MEHLLETLVTLECSSLEVTTKGPQESANYKHIDMVEGRDPKQEQHIQNSIRINFKYQLFCSMGVL